jgi:copper chaperone CopZ
VSAIAGVTSVAVDLEAKTVSVAGTALDRGRIVAAIDEAGFDVG